MYAIRTVVSNGFIFTNIYSFKSKPIYLSNRHIIQSQFESIHFYEAHPRTARDADIAIHSVGLLPHCIGLAHYYSFANAISSPPFFFFIYSSAFLFVSHPYDTMITRDYKIINTKHKEIASLIFVLSEK